MRIPILAVAAVLAAFPGTVEAWGRTGHRVTGAIADEHLDAHAKAGIRELLGPETLSEASTWPDLMRSDPSKFWQKTANPYHYVTVPPDRTYAQAGAPPQGDAVTALRGFSATVRDRNAPAADRRLALRFIVHIVGDLHQPLHAGNGQDDGGNKVRVTFFGRNTNLHALWDSGLIDEEQLSYTEYAAWLSARITPATAKQWATPDPTVWIAESAALRDQVYPVAGETALSFRYVFANKARLEDRLSRAGVRLAAYLNELFGAAGTRPR